LLIKDRAAAERLKNEAEALEVAKYRLELSEEARRVTLR